MQGIGKEDCELMMQVINIASTKGCLRGDDLYVVGTLFEKLRYITSAPSLAADQEKNEDID